MKTEEGGEDIFMPPLLPPVLRRKAVLILQSLRNREEEITAPWTESINNYQNSPTSIAPGCPASENSWGSHIQAATPLRLKAGSTFNTAARNPMLQSQLYFPLPALTCEQCLPRKQKADDRLLQNGSCCQRKAQMWKTPDCVASLTGRAYIVPTELRKPTSKTDFVHCYFQKQLQKRTHHYSSKSTKLHRHN